MPVAQDRVARYLARIERERDTLEELAVRVAEGETLAEVCKAWDVPFGRFAAWIAADGRRQELYDGALRLRADFEAGEVIRIADAGGGDTAHAALRLRARQWAASKWDRARYGESVQVEHTGETVVRLSFGGRVIDQPEEIREAIASGVVGSHVGFDVAESGGDI